MERREGMELGRIRNGSTKDGMERREGMELGRIKIGGTKDEMERREGMELGRIKIGQQANLEQILKMKRHEAVFRQEIEDE